MIDFEPMRRREKSLQDLAEGLTREDLSKLTQEMCARELALIEDAKDEDVAFVPDDPEANDTFASQPEDVGLSWTLGALASRCRGRRRRPSSFCATESR